MVTAIICLILVSTHTLQVECDIGKIGSEYGGYVSTHTLQVECDGMTLSTSYAANMFQLTHSKWSVMANISSFSRRIA